MEEDQRLLERILDGAEDPTNLSLTLLQDITDNFSEERKIGQGGFGTVYKGVLGERFVSVKRIHINVHTVDDKLFRREATSLLKINHRSVVRFLGVCSQGYQKPIDQDGSGKYIWANVFERLLCFEYISNGSLDKHITDELRGLEWEARYEIITGICKGLRYLHTEREIIHMDLKPENILLDHQDGKYMVPKITDFGLSRSNENSHTVGKSYGTRGYWAPEYRDDSKTTSACDIYSLGLIIIELVTGCKDIPEKNKVLRRWRHRWSKPPTQLRYQQVTRCMEIAGCCRAEKPEARPSISKVISFLNESESTYGPIIPCLDEDDMLRINPLELLLPSELKNEISHSVELTNDALNCIAFNIQSPNDQPAVNGILPPGCKYVVTITVQARDVGDKFVVKSMKWTEGLGQEYIIECMSGAEAHKVVDEVDLMVVYEPTKSQKNRKHREDTNMPAEEVPEAKKRKIVFSSSGKGKPKLDSSENAEATSMDIISSLRGQCTSQKKRCNLHTLQSFSRNYPTSRKYLVRESDPAVDHARGAMGSLLDKLGKLITEDYSLDLSIKSDIEYFSVQLAIMHRDVPKLQNIDDANSWVDEIRELSFEIEDMVDRFLVHDEPNSSGVGGFKEIKHEELNLLVDGIATHHQINNVISYIKDKVQAVADRQKMYNIVVRDVVANAATKVTIDPRMAMYINKEQLIGIEAPRDALMSLLEEDGDVSKKELMIVSIVGMGGLGKTTLAKAVYDKLQAQYNLKGFVAVGQNPDVVLVLKEIIRKFVKNFNGENLNVPELIQELQELLEDKRYLIVIDDVWDPSAWGVIRSAFPRNERGSRVITTTRILSVALDCCNSESKYVYRIKPLSEKDSEELFFRRIYGSRKDCHVTPRKEEISKYILERCSGMPLAINSIASLLAGGKDSKWEYVLKTLGALSEGNGIENMKEILDLSYTHLPDHLKTCLLYVCMYPEDREIDKNELLRKWVAEGFVHMRRNGVFDAEDVAEQYLEELINMCMIQPESIDYNNEVLSCRVHDIIHDLMRSKSSKENFIQVIDGLKDVTIAPGPIRRVSVHSNNEEDSRTLGTIKGFASQCSHVRSVCLYGISPPVHYFLVFKYIRVLHLETRGILDLIDISRLFLLRYLKISYYGIFRRWKLPDQIGELQQLETIDLEEGHGLIKYPSDTASLPRLLHLSTGHNYMALPDGICRLKSLRTLQGVDLYESTVDSIKGLGELTNLRKLYISPGMVVQKEEMDLRMNAFHSSISRLSTSLRILCFEDRLPSKVDVTSWSRPLFCGVSHIRELDLYCCIFQNCPEWIRSLHHLYSLSITVREVADCLSIVSLLPSLVYFCLETEEPKEESVVISGRGAFQALKHLCFYCKKATLTFEEGALPKLEKLEIWFRINIIRRFLPVGIQHLPAHTLKQIYLIIIDRERDCWKVKGSEHWNNRAWERYLSSNYYWEKVIENDRKSWTLLKRAFKSHHPSADIYIHFDNEDPQRVDDEEDYEEYGDEEDEEDAYDDEDYKEEYSYIEENYEEYGDEEDEEDAYDDEDYKEEYSYIEEDDDGAYQVNGSQTSAWIQANTRQLVELIEEQKDSGKMSINTDAPPMLDTSLHLAIGSEWQQTGRTQELESLQLPLTRLLASSPSSIHLTLAPFSSPDTAPPGGLVGLSRPPNQLNDEEFLELNEDDEATSINCTWQLI